jgi:hypothetical protein
LGQAAGKKEDDMSRDPYLVEIAWDTVNRLLADWQREPYRWSKEIDFQVELASRLGTVLDVLGRGTIVANYPDPIPGFEKRQIWSRVCCEAKVKYVYEDGASYDCLPDVVVWDDIPDADHPPDDGDGAYPILWLCEIKLDAAKPGNWDVEKLTYLVTQDRARFGCWLNLTRSRCTSGTGISWRKPIDRLWICDATLPPTG